MQGRVRLCLRAEYDPVVALSADGDATAENKYCGVPGPGEQLSEVAPPIALKGGRSVAGKFLSLALMYAL